MKVPHMQDGHLNIFTLDHDSVVTSKGKHDRVVCFLPQFEPDYGKVCLYCRVDTHHNLGLPTANQILTVARKDQGVKGKYRLIDVSDKYGLRDSIDYVFEKL
ncbi:hypothetical protein NVP1170O_100 [Vibrio phage 1.170.O._10N.261.52.C3]|nr:hypothetical protein NVP1170O_100 [Vibrio phage 1.170.O._10N.261.52.C3]